MSFEITPNAEMKAEEYKVIETFIKFYIDKVLHIQAFNSMRAEEVTKLLKSNLHPFERIDTKKLLNQGEPLTAQEKRELGINARLKVNHDFLKYINLNFVDKTDLFGFITEAEFYGRARAWSEREINRAKKLKASLKLNVDKDSCPQSVDAEGTYSVKQAPLLPLPTCGKKCVCIYLTEVSW